MADESDELLRESCGVNGGLEQADLEFESGVQEVGGVVSLSSFKRETLAPEAFLIFIVFVTSVCSERRRMRARRPLTMA